MSYNFSVYGNGRRLGSSSGRINQNQGSNWDEWGYYDTDEDDRRRDRRTRQDTYYGSSSPVGLSHMESSLLDFFSGGALSARRRAQESPARTSNTSNRSSGSGSSRTNSDIPIPEEFFSNCDDQENPFKYIRNDYEYVDKRAEYSELNRQIPVDGPETRFLNEEQSVEVLAGLERHGPLIGAPFDAFGNGQNGNGAVVNRYNSLQRANGWSPGNCFFVTCAYLLGTTSNVVERFIGKRQGGAHIHEMVRWWAAKGFKFHGVHNPRYTVSTDGVTARLSDQVYKSFPPTFGCTFNYTRIRGAHALCAKKVKTRDGQERNEFRMICYQHNDNGKVIAFDGLVMDYVYWMEPPPGWIQWYRNQRNGGQGRQQAQVRRAMPQATFDPRNY